MSIAAVRRLALCFVGSWLLVTATACAGAPPVVKIGLVAPFEGRGRFVGYDIIYSARLAVRQANEEALLGRYRVALVTLDDGGNEASARNAAATLIADPAIVGVIGHGLLETATAAAPLYAAAGMPFVPLPSSTLTAVPPESLPDHFLALYRSVTPFDEAAGPLAAPTYDAFTLLLTAVLNPIAAGQQPTRHNVGIALPNLSVRGITGQMVTGQ